MAETRRPAALKPHEHRTAMQTLSQWGLLLNHVWHFFLLPLLWATLLHLLASAVFRQHARQVGRLGQRLLFNSGAAVLWTLLALGLSGGVSTMLHYAVLGAGFALTQIVLLRLWRP